MQGTVTPAVINFNSYVAKHYYAPFISSQFYITTVESALGGSFIQPLAATFWFNVLQLFTVRR